ncbi:MAG: hypothetical protein HXY20_04570, partial [Acidobacteria bacterium]|nr:hypothetical protein [Acidobacteriota bacterium]
MFSILADASESRDRLVQTLKYLWRECVCREYFEAALSYVASILPLEDDPGEKACCYL